MTVPGCVSNRVVHGFQLWALLVAFSSVSVTCGCGSKTASPSATDAGSQLGGLGSIGGRAGTGGNAPASGGSPALASGGSSQAPTGGTVGNGGSSATLGSSLGGSSMGGSAAATGGNVAVATGGNLAIATGGNIAVATGGNLAIATGGNVAVATGGNVAVATGGSAAAGGTATGGTVAASTGGTSAGGAGNIVGPCDIYAAANPPTPCVAAYSTARLLNSKYSGPLYQVRKGSTPSDAGPAIQDIGVAAGGFADSTAQDSFCGAARCTVSKIYDQSGRGNHLTQAPANCYGSTGHGGEPAYESDAKGRALTVAGHKVYALYMIPQDGYRNNQTVGMPVDAEAQGIYEVVDGTRYNSACCWDFGNGSTNNCNSSVGTVSALFFGTGYWGTGAGSGPWFMADFQTVWSGGTGGAISANPNNPTITYDFAMGILKTNATNYAIRVANARSGNLVTAYDGALPFASLKMKGGIILGIGSDRSDGALGTFFEGAITAGRPSDETDAAVLANVQAAKYGQ